jgi:hypothetical protein
VFNIFSPLSDAIAFGNIIRTRAQTMQKLYRLAIAGLILTLSAPAWAVTAIPEPASMSLFGIGAIGALTVRTILRRRK